MSSSSRRSFLKGLSALAMTSLVGGRSQVAEETGNLHQNPRAPNVLIVVFDAFSAKNMSLYGYSRETTPHLARLAERATVYHAHYAGGNYTTPGTSSLVTGTYPWSHRAFNTLGTFAEGYDRQNLFSALAKGTYRSVAYSNNWAAHLCLNQLRKDIDALLNPGSFSLFEHAISDRVFPNDQDIAYRSERFFLRGLLLNKVETVPGSLILSLGDETLIRARKRAADKRYASLFPRGVPHTNTSSFLLEHIIDGIADLVSRSSQSFLAYFQPLPPHDPYCPRREFVGLFDDGWTPVAKERHFFDEGHSAEYLNQMRREYDENIAYVDAEFGRLYDFMEQSGMVDNTYIVLTSDHGEMFERGVLRHMTPTLFEPIIRIPLLILKPGQRQREDVYTPTSCVDLLPTLFHLTGQAVPDWSEGRVLPPFRDAQAGSERSVYAVEAKNNLKVGPLTRATVAMIKGQYKLVHYFGYKGYEDEYELYDVSNDPEEMKDLSASHPSILADLSNELSEKLREVNQPYMAG